MSPFGRDNNKVRSDQNWTRVTAIHRWDKNEMRIEQKSCDTSSGCTWYEDGIGPSAKALLDEIRMGTGQDPLADTHLDEKPAIRMPV
ncbi:hypothetical protein SLA2020_264640 [Shorea laevis]